MDNYGSNNISTGSSYSSLPSIAPQQLQHNGSQPPHTLPPLQPQHAAMSMHSMYGQPMTAPHTPSTSAPNTPGSVGNGGYQQQQMGGQSAPRGYQLHANPYQQQTIQPYQTSSAMMPQTSSSMSHPQPIAPAPAPNRLVPLRPMTSAPPLQHGIHHGQMPPGMSSPYGQQPLPQEDHTPTHVVGSQGRRGILPSAPGRPTVSATGTGSTKNAVIPAKDADGKFPCPHCTKTYLHAKHLKRHLLRHTGDRPYMCVLCRDTFSRSDILKRHFQKCSIRRGNPTGASHLSHAQAHLKKSHPGPHKVSGSTASDGDLMRNINGLNGGMPNDQQVMLPFGVQPLSESAPHMGDDHNADMARSDSLKRMSSGGTPRDRRSMTGPGPNGANRASFDQGYNNGIPSSMPSSMNPQLAGYGIPGQQPSSNYGQNYEFTSQNGGHPMNAHQGNGDMSAMGGGRGMPMYGGAANAQQSGVDWSHMFQPGAQDGFVSPFNPSLGLTQIQNPMAIKPEPPMTHASHGIVNSIYPVAAASPDGANVPGGYPSWTIPTDPLQQVANLIFNFCCSSEPPLDGQSSDFRHYLSADNIKHFLELYSNFQGHFPIIHTPTFNITDVYEGLLLAMVCIGAVYSDRMSQDQVRQLMDRAKMVIERDSPVLSSAGKSPSGDNTLLARETPEANKKDLEGFQALWLLEKLFVWHGTPVQREAARRTFPTLINSLKDAGLTQASASPQLYSVLHQANVTVENVNASNFDWNAWVEQEKRSRLVYAFFLEDCSMALYFNVPPQLDAFDIRLPLPADDAAWDAKTPTQCAGALGLHGPVVARSVNADGSRRPKQPEIDSVLSSLLDPTLSFKPGTTNIFSKFLLVHALHVQIWRAQKQLSQSTPDANGQLPTPPETGTNAQYSLGTTNVALDKWKQTWDTDVAHQYPPSSNNYRRFGFCRDGVHFFWLAKYLFKNRLDWQLAPDQRFSQIMASLKYIRNWVVSDSGSRGEELGSITDIDQDYGASDLTLDMTQLFRPLDKRIDSPVSGIYTDISRGV